MVTLLATALVTTLTFTNTTPYDVRIRELRNKCTGYIVEEGKPVYLKPGRSYTVATTDVVHTYTICGNGLCVSSAIGIKSGTKDVKLEVTDDQGLVNTKQSPDVWNEGNFTCNEK
jgi:hypothetical protein